MKENSKSSFTDGTLPGHAESLPTPSQIQTSEEVTIRSAKPTDIYNLVYLERHSDQEDLYSDTEFLFLMEDTYHDLLIAECDKRLVGYLAYELKANYDRVLAVVIAPSFRKLGIGKHILALLSRRKTLAMVREHDVNSQLFLRSCNFKWAKTHQNAFECPADNAYVMRRDA